MEHGTGITGSTGGSVRGGDGLQPPLTNNGSVYNNTVSARNGAPNSMSRLIAPSLGSTRFQQQPPSSAQVSSILRGGRMSASLQQMTISPSTTSTISTTVTSSSVIPQQEMKNTIVGGSGNTPALVAHALSTTTVGTTSNHPSQQPSSIEDAAMSGVGTVTDEKLQSRGNNTQLVSRAEFCQFDVLACINCISRDSEERSQQGNSGTTATVTGRKLGPVLLDLRRLSFTSNSQSDTVPSLFSTSVIAQSRGNPSLGSSISSTCLSVQSNPPNNSSSTSVLPPNIATGLSTGALCIHSFTDEYQSTIEYYQIPRNNRPATSVAWRQNHVSQVAIGYSNSSTSGAIGTTTSGSSSPLLTSSPQQTHAPLRRTLQQAGVNMGGATGGGLSSNPSTVVDRQYCCFLWDVEHQAPSIVDETVTLSPTIRRTKTTPLYKLSHNQSVSCLSWILDESGGQLLAVGGQQRDIQIYDLRMSGSTSTTTAVQPSPISSYGHSLAVHGIESDPTRPWHFCTFASHIGEVVKIWDARRIDSPLSEIKPVGTKNSTSTVSSARWSTLCPGHLSILVGESTLSTYDTFSTISRPILTSTVRASKPIASFAQYPYANMHNYGDAANAMSHKEHMLMELFPKQIVAVGLDQSVDVVACHRIAPLAVSPRTGQVIHAIGQSVLLGSTSDGLAAMEGSELQLDDDISKIIMRRAQGSGTEKYSMDLTPNIAILAEELLISIRSSSSSSSTEQLLRLWKWVQLAERLCQDDTPNWPAKSLIDSGVAKLFEVDKGKPDNQVYSDSLSCATYDSEGRRAALASCGWAGMFDLGSVMTDCESRGEFERSAALAIWHGNIEFAVDSLERGAVFYATAGTKRSGRSRTYSETLEHVALSIAGYQGGEIKPSEIKPSATSVWQRSCAKLLQRPDLSDLGMSGGACYLRHVLKFLMLIGTEGSHRDILSDTALGLCDRIAFACRFLSNADLMSFINNCIQDCQSNGNVEGLVITGLDVQGINILQSYVDATADIQTAALLTSRVVFPQDWPSVRRVVDEWLYSYRTLLNTWQMWQHRAMFDVDRASVHRVAKMRLQLTTGGGTATNSRHRQIPAQLDARCNYCSSPLGLRRQDNQPNHWLSKMKNVLPCCPRCRKPLPRCSICMLSLGVPNPYYELTKQRSSSPAIDDLSTLANLPFAEWFSWCLRCKHGGHAHHLMGWFAKHEVCPVSGCSCRCQFDGIRELPRPTGVIRPDAITARPTDIL